MNNHTVIAVSGAGATGKSAICRALKTRIKDSVYIEGDLLIAEIFRYPQQTGLIEYFALNGFANIEMTKIVSSYFDAAEGCSEEAEEICRIFHEFISSFMMRLIDHIKKDSTVIVEWFCLHLLPNFKPTYFFYFEAPDQLRLSRADMRNGSTDEKFREVDRCFSRPMDFTRFTAVITNDGKMPIEAIVDKIEDYFV